MYVFGRVHAYACLGTHVEVRGQLAEVSSLHCVTSKDQTQAWWETSLLLSHPSGLLVYFLRQGLSLSLGLPSG